MKETHMDYLLSAVNYREHKWLICVDHLKVFGLIRGFQGGLTKYPCFLYL